MKINSINLYNQTFKGKAYINYNKAATQIKESPYSTQESIIGNINTLKHRLENQTPDDKTFIIDYSYSTKKDSVFLPTFHYGTIQVKDEKGNFAAQEFYLGQSGGSRKDDKTVFSSGEEIWENGFEPITKTALKGLPEANQDKKAIEEIKAEIKTRGWMEEDRDPSINPCWKNSGTFLSEQQAIEEIKAIYDRIEDRGKVIMDKADIAVSLWKVTSRKECPKEILDSIIGNINTLTKRVEEETAKEKKYYLSVSNLFGYNDGYDYDDSYRYHDDEVKIILATNNYSYQKGYITTSVLDEKNWKYYCPTDPEKIYTKVFKPLTDKTLWDGHHYMPFDKDWEKREIVNKLD